MISVEFSKDGAYLATGDGAGSIKIWDTVNYELIYTLEAEFDNAVVDLEFNEDATVLASGHQRLGTHLWSLDENPPSLSILSGDAQVLSFSPDFEVLAMGYYTSLLGEPTISVLDIAEDIITSLIGHPEQATSIAFSNTGDILVSGGKDHSIKFWDIMFNQEIFMLEEHRDLVSGVEFNQNQTMLVSVSWDGTLIVWGILED